MNSRIRAGEAVLVLLTFSSALALGQGPTTPRQRAAESVHQAEKADSPRSLSAGETAVSESKSGLGKWLLIGGIVIAAGVVLYLLLAKKKTTSLTPPPPGAKVGAIAITSEPPGAKIFLDGSDTGQITPATLATVAVGSRTLRLELASYGKWEDSVVVVENQTANVSAALAPYVYAFVTKWGSPGTGDGRFNLPSGLAVDPSGNIYVTDSFNQRVQKFTSTGTFLGKWGGEGTAPGRFGLIDGIAADAAGNIYVADGALTDFGTYNHRIQKFDSNGVFLAQWGSYGQGDGQFYTPVGLSISRTGFLYAVDMDLWRVQKFTTAGAYLLKWGSFGAGNSQFQRPHFSTVDADGNVYVSEYDGFRVQKFTANGAFLTKWGSPGAGDNQFQNPAGILADRAGYILVCDSMNHRIVKFARDGRFIGKWGSLGAGDGQFNEAVGIAEDAMGFIYVSDYRNQRIQKFQLTTATAMAAAKIIYSPLPARGGKRAAQAAPVVPESSREAVLGTESKTHLPPGKKEKIKATGG